MRRKINLYIANQLVDLDDQSFILFNYTMDDLSNPTIVKNSFSQQITLKGTAANNKIFGDAYKADRRVGHSGGETGVDFNASHKTPFTIYNEMGEILESGYVKLDSISRNGADIQYKVTLYGGLGSFFYALSYDDNGNKRTLADLSYLNTSNPDTELDFEITADAIRDAWRALEIGKQVVTRSTRYTGYVLDEDGNLTGADQYSLVDKFDITTDKIYVTGYVGTAVNAVAAFLDDNDNVVGVYIPGAEGSLVDYEVNVPTGATRVLVSGNEAYTPPFLKEPTPAMWDVINFAPAYNGIPDGNFSPDKALVSPTSVGLQDYITEDGVTYTTKGGYALVNLAKAQDEWAVKDLRSYLQRPVLSMRAFWDAICNPENNGGYEVNASIIKDDTLFGKYANLWMTLPMITSIGTTQQSSGDLSLSMTPTSTTRNLIGRFDIQGTVPVGTIITANLSCEIRYDTPLGADNYDTLSLKAAIRYGRGYREKFGVLFVQAIAYSSDNTIMGGSKIVCIGAVGRNSGAAMATACGFTPWVDADYETMSADSLHKVSSGVFALDGEVGLTVTAMDVAYYRIAVAAYSGECYNNGQTNTYAYSGDGTSSRPTLYHDYGIYYHPIETSLAQGASGNTITYTTSETLRSGATITKKMLLSSSHSPAEYMLSFCKVFGLYFSYDSATRNVTILRRDDLYEDDTIDLTRRVDLSKGVSIQPLVFDAKWYDFALEGVGGAFYDEYQNVVGLQYGIHRVNTGYDFNAESVDLMESVVFKDACTTLARSKYFNVIFDGQTFQPSPFVDPGNTYTLWASSGDTLDTDISCPPASATIDYYNSNPSYKGYDVDNAGKLELRDSDNKPIDGADILVFHEGWNVYDYFKLTDDVPAMDALNNGVPCWLIGAGGGVNVPNFQRYSIDLDNTIVDSLDFGTPKELDIPGIRYTDGCTIYARGWKNYMSDRYDENTKVMTCRVDFTGIQVTQELLRKFYWYDKTLWVLNKIKNYSLTTFDPVECEFVQVQDKANYLNGQDY